MKKTPHLAALAAAIALSCGAAQAGPFYAGLAGGQSSQSLDCTGTVTCNNSGTAFKLYGGWDFMPNVSAEVTYYSLGTAKSSVGLLANQSSTRVRPQVAASAVDIDVSGSYIGLGVAGRANFNSQFGGLVRGGATFANGKVSATSNAGGGSFSETRDSTLHAYIGLGAFYAINDKVKLTLDYDHTRLAVKVTDPYGNALKETHDVNIWAVGAAMAF